ncbi:MAG: hypothetical protein HKP45_08120 [Winogradskyella sp.]|nr:hypothetical protein [Winogradskyella sp.]
MRKLLILFLLVYMSCDNERIVQLPEIENATITQVNDVSAAYIFYDETQADSSLLNRKNLISTTNWLVNVDKRLLLYQVVDDITFLQNKKRNATVHKNEKARNYFTCNDISIKNLGFLDFTDVYYKQTDAAHNLRENENYNNHWILTCYTNKAFALHYPNEDFELTIDPNELTTSLNVVTDVIDLQKSKQILLQFEDAIAFQNYITIKNTLQQTKHPDLTIVSEEYLFH